MASMAGALSYLQHNPTNGFSHPTDAVSLTLEYCQQRFPVNLYPYDQQHESFEEYELDVDDLPWDCLPGVHELSISTRERNDVCDGQLIGDITIREARAVLQTFVDHCCVARVDLDVYDGFTFEDLSSFAKTCLVLQILGQRQCLPIFMARRATDDCYPLSNAIIAEALGDDPGSASVFHFLVEQSRFDTRLWERGEHIKLARHEILPFKSIRPLGHGAQGSVDAIEFIIFKTRWARKRWRSPNVQSKKRFFREIYLLKRLDSRRHIVEIINTYVRGTEVGIVMTLAECDLAHVLSLSAEERRIVIPDDDLRKAYGCLSFSLAHMHDLGIRHKDIKPQNVLVRNGVLLFTDFGTSQDYSELSNSLTVGGTNTRKYAAPEFTGDVNHQGPADVFALGLVLLSVWSVLEGWRPDQVESFSHIAADSPFCEKMGEMDKWIIQRLRAEVQPPEPNMRNVYQRRWDLLLLRVLSKMIKPVPSERVRIAEVIALFHNLSVEASFCCSCQKFIREEPVESVDVDWTLDFVNPSTEVEHSQKHQGNTMQYHLTESDDSDVEGVEIIHEQVLADEEEDVSEVVSPHDEKDGNGQSEQVTNKDDNEPQQEQDEILHESVQIQETQAQTPKPLALGASVSETKELKIQQINFVDCLQRKFACPFQSVNTWKGMSTFIKKKFPTDIPQIAHISAEVHASHYDLVGDNGFIIDEDFWDDIIQPGWTVRMEMWPLSAIEGPEYANTNIQEPVNTESLPTYDTVAELREEKVTKESHIQLPTRSRRPSLNETPPVRDSLTTAQDTNSSESVKTEASTYHEVELVTCPVCIDFKGNKEEVNHHVSISHRPTKETEIDVPDTKLETTGDTEASATGQEAPSAQKTPPTAEPANHGASNEEQDSGEKAKNQTNATGQDKAAEEPAPSRAAKKSKTLKTKTSTKRLAGFFDWVAQSAGPSTSGSRKSRGSALAARKSLDKTER